MENKDNVIPGPVLDWLKSNPITLHWDFMMACPLPVVQSWLQKKFELALIDGRIPTGMSAEYYEEVANFLVRLENYRLAAPVLDIEQATYNKDAVELHVDLEGGSQSLIDYRGYIQFIVANGAVNPLKVKLTLPLRYENGQLCMNMARAEKYTMSLGYSDLAPYLGAKIAKNMFESLAPETQSFSLASIIDASNPLFNVRHLTVCSQAQDDNKRRAVLLLFALDQGREGFTPDSSTRLPELCSVEQGDEDICTVLLSRRTAGAAAYVKAIQNVVKDANWQFDRDDQGRLTRLWTQNGVINVPMGACGDGFFNFKSTPFELSAAAGDGEQDAALAINVYDEHVDQVWHPNYQVSATYKSLVDEQWHEDAIPLTSGLDFRYTLLPDSAQERAQLGNIGPEASYSRMEHFAAYTQMRGFINALSEHLHAAVSQNLLSVFQAEQGTSQDGPVRASLLVRNMNVPGAIALQGRFQNGDQPLRIKQQALELLPGEICQFVTEPSRAGIEWGWQLLQGPDVGKELLEPATGKYTAPTVEQLKGNTQRVRIIATDPASREQHDTLVTVTGSLLEVSPAFRQLEGAKIGDDFVVEALAPRALSGNSVGWTITNLFGKTSGALTPNGHRATYKIIEYGGTDYCSIDRIDARLEDSSGNEMAVQFAVMVNVHRPSSVVVVPVEEDVEAGTLKLQAILGGISYPARWEILEGPGSLDPDEGLYKEDREASGAFVIVHARIPEEDDYPAEDGHYVLPLPLGRFAGAREQQREYVQSLRDNPMLRPTRE